MRLFLIIFFLTQVISQNNAHALDKRIRLLFKTSGYGAAAGGIIGLGTFAMGLGNYRNILMGASSGLYAGMALAGYIIATPNEDESKKKKFRHGSRKPIGNDEWENENNDEEILKEHVPIKDGEEDDQSSREFFFRYQFVDNKNTNPFTTQFHGATLWMPLLALEL